MSTLDFSPLFRATVGFDRLTRLLEDAAQWGETANSYPPYNIEKIGNDRYRITLAVAGFSESDLAIHVQQNTLVVEGRKQDGEGSGAYLHRGIAARGFKRHYQLADHVEVVEASLDNGLLVIDLKREVPEAMKPRRVDITRSSPVVEDAGDKKVIEGGRSAA